MAIATHISPAEAVLQRALLTFAEGPLRKELQDLRANLLQDVREELRWHLRGIAVGLDALHSPRAEAQSHHAYHPRSSSQSHKSAQRYAGAENCQPAPPPSLPIALPPGQLPHVLPDGQGAMHAVVPHGRGSEPVAPPHAPPSSSHDVSAVHKCWHDQDPYYDQSKTCEDDIAHDVTMRRQHSLTHKEKGDKPKPAIFPDSTEMKAKARQATCQKKYDVMDFYHTEGRIQEIARSTWFDNGTLSVIAINAIWIAIETDNNTSVVLSEAPPIFQVAEHFFCAYFTVEILIRFCAFAQKYRACMDGWFVFDSILVVTMVLETWVLTLVTALMASGTEGGGVGDASVLRLLRLLRLTRMARMARLLRSSPELMILIKGAVAASRSVFFTLVLLVTLMYVFGIFFKQIMQDSITGELHFQSVPKSMYSLLIFGILLDEVSNLTELVVDDGEYLFLALFLLFILLASFTVMNMLIGVLCEVVSVVASVEKESALVENVKWQLGLILRDNGIEESQLECQITKDKYMCILAHEDAPATFAQLGVDVVTLVDFAEFIFDESTTSLTFLDFMDVVLQLHGSNGATVKDLVHLRKSMMVNLVSTQHALQAPLVSISAKVDALSKSLEKSTRISDLALRDTNGVV
eukprot:gnl/TRDRNA2_/TRDRNA2_166820_c0_seq1.p1 gnl/TRDRNA2_/TRDRNA2_166820_c0~~gnl/TRDRNA2_/TRDRNA2_166820_c0_seq1.p1  ORF type:complete len:635 (-),score=96.93 gnl/TRDRNA2_/TRDRNA2_166820_c0_seq1:61-1965(-)